MNGGIDVIGLTIHSKCLNIINHHFTPFKMSLIFWQFQGLRGKQRQKHEMQGKYG
jgi:hypothetical protein